MWRGLAGAVAALCVLAGVLRGDVRAQDAPAADGMVSGKVIDKSTGDPLIDAGVEIVGANKRGRTDLDGKYSLKVPPGTYQVRFFAALYQGARIDDVRVVAGQTAKVDAALAPEGAGAGVETVEVVAKADKQAEAIQLLERKNAATVSDNIGAETIKESPDSNAAEVVVRVPAVTVRENKYVYVRGLGERYSTALLNGSKLPSTDPNKRVVPLDLFPADFIESLAIVKGYTADLPGDFSGGLVDIHLRDAPDHLTYGFGLSVSGDTNTTFDDFLTYPGTSGDLVGFGKGSRSLPTIIPDRDIDQCPACTPDMADPDAQMRAYAGAFKNVWTPNDKTAPTNFSVNANVGNTFGPFAIALAGIWNLDYQTLPTELANKWTNPFPSGAELFTYRRSTQVGRLGGVLTTSYTIDDDNRISFRALDNHVGTDTVLDGSGTTIDATTDPPVRSETALLYTEQNLGYGQLQGEHHFKPVSINWRSALAQTTLDQPDARYITRNVDGTFVPNSNSGLRTFLTLDEYLTDSAVDFTIPFVTGLPFTDVWSGLPAKFKLGPAYTYRKRELDYRRFRFAAGENVPYVNTAAPAETFLIPLNVARTGREFQFIEDTRDSDTFTASQEIAAMYGLVDTPIIADELRLNAGVRVEYSYIKTDGFFIDGAPASTRLNDLDPLPGVNLVWNPRSLLQKIWGSSDGEEEAATVPQDMNIRLGFSRTVSRPEFRELTPTEFVEPLGFRNVIGNPDLVEATIDSYDLRWEWFLSESEVLSLGGFYKSMKDPIEQIVISQGSQVADSFQNADSAALEGFEFELRKNFGFLGEPLSKNVSGAVADQARNLSLLLNVSYVHSNVEIGTNAVGSIRAGGDHPLQGQSPYVINAGLEYDYPELFTSRLFYNTAGETVVAVATQSTDPNSPVIPDIVQAQRGQLDFVLTSPLELMGVPIKTKLSIENILNSAYLQTQGSENTSRFRTGVQFGVGISYSF